MTTTKTYTLLRYTERHYELKCGQIPFKTFKGTSVRIDLKKDILVDEHRGRLRAKTFGYSYNANLPNPDGRNLIRYCSPLDDHNQFHHRHNFTIDLDTTTKIGDDNYPHVGEFLNEVLESF